MCSHLAFHEQAICLAHKRIQLAASRLQSYNLGLISPSSLRLKSQLKHFLMIATWREFIALPRLLPAVCDRQGIGTIDLQPTSAARFGSCMALRSNLTYYSNQAQWRLQEIKGSFVHWHSIVVGKRQQRRYMPLTTDNSGAQEEGAPKASRDDATHDSSSCKAAA